MRVGTAFSLLLSFVGIPSAAAQPGRLPACERVRLFSEECRPLVHTVAIRFGGNEAQMQLVAPGEAPVKFTVIIVGGGLVGSTAFTSDVWRPMCARLACALAHFDVVSDRQPASVADDPGRNANTGSGDALLTLLDTLAVRTGHPELGKAKVALFGFSAAGSFAVTFAARHPARILTAVRYHSHLRGLIVDSAALVRVPILFIASTSDSTAGVDDTRRFWEWGRRADAPWALAVESGRAHMSLDSWFESSDLIWHWFGALAKDAAEPTAESGWFGAMQDRSITRGPVRRPSAQFSWFPDSATAASWRRLSRGLP